MAWDAAFLPQQGSRVHLEEPNNKIIEWGEAVSRVWKHFAMCSPNLRGKAAEEARKSKVVKETK